MDNEFVTEAEELIGKLNNDLLHYEKYFRLGKKADPEVLNSIFRSAHTLKGLAGFSGHVKLGKLAHATENLLSSLRLGKITANQEVLDLLFESAEKLEALLSEEQIAEIDIDSFSLKLDKFSEAQPAILQKEVPIKNFGLPDEIVKALSEYEEHRLAENISEQANICLVKSLFPLEISDTKLDMLKTWLNNHGEVIATLPMSADCKIPAIAFHLVFATKKDTDKLGKFLNRYKYEFEILKRGSL